MQDSEKEKLKLQFAKAWLWIVGTLFVCGYVLAWIYQPAIAIGASVAFALFIPAGVTGWAIAQVMVAIEFKKEKERKQNNKF